MSQSKRIYGLDGLKAVLLLGGPLVHALPEIPNLPVPVLLWDAASFAFRMQAFFIISGFLVGSLYKSYSVEWLINRLRQILVPLFSMTCVMGMLIIWYQNYAYKAYGDWTMYPLHLWFLWALAIATLTSFFMDRTGVNRRITDALDHRPYALTIIAVVMLLGIRFVSTYFIRHYWGATPPFVIELMFGIFPKYTICYLLGFFLARSKVSLDKVNKPSVIAAGFLILTLYLVNYYVNHNDLARGSHFGLAKAFNNSIIEIASVYTALSVFLVGLRIQKIPSWLFEFSKYSYTVYLFHYPAIIVAYCIVTYHLPNLDVRLLYVAMVVVGLSVSCAVHVLVMKSQVLQFLFNGKKLSFFSSRKVTNSI